MSGGNFFPRQLRQTGLLALVSVVVCGGVIVALSTLENFSFLRSVCFTCAPTLSALLALFFLSVIQTTVSALMTIIPIAGFVARYGIFRLVLITALASAVNAFVPAKGGTLLKAFVFHHKFSVTYQRFAALHGYVALVVAVVSVLVLLVFLDWQRLEQLVGRLAPMAPGYLLVGVTVISAALGLVLAARKFKMLVFGTRAFARDLVRRSGVVGALAVVQLAAMGARAFLAAVMLGAQPNWQSTLVFGSILSIAPLVSVLPGGVGTREALFVLAGWLSGIPTALSVSAALVDRLVGTISVVGMGIFGLPTLREAYADLSPRITPLE